MANLLTQNPISLNTVMAQSYKTLVAAALGTLWTLRVSKIVFTPAAATDTATITDVNGVTICTLGNSNAAVISIDILDWSAKPKLWTDFRLSQISAPGDLVQIYTD